MNNQIEDFENRLVRHGETVGSRYCKADFHIHMPGSSDYEYSGDDALDLMAQQITETGLEIATIVKHQEFPTKEELASLQAKCKSTQLLPGAELNLFVDALDKKVGKDYFFHCLVIGTPDQNFDYPLNKAKDELSHRGTSYPAGFDSAVRDVGKHFLDNGQLFIPAHLHQTHSPEKSRAIDDVYDDDAFLGFVESGCFTALEVRSRSTAEFFSGDRKTQDGRPIPGITCVQSSDAHHHEHLRQRSRCTWLQIEKPCFTELAAALSFPHRVLLTEPQNSHSGIVGLHIVGSFLPDLWIPLNSGITCFIGCKGSGKTSVLECIRFVLNTQVPKERQESVQKHLQHILGASGFVECLVEEATGTKKLISRRIDSPDRIRIVHEDATDSPEEVPSSLGTPVDISVLGWHEIEAVADRPRARTHLVDETRDSSEIKRLYDTINVEVEKARDELPLLQRAIRSFQRQKREYLRVKRRRQSLQKLQQAELFKLQNRYERIVNAISKLQSLADHYGQGRQRIAGLVQSEFAVDTTDLAVQPADVGDLRDVLESTTNELPSRNAEGSQCLNNASGKAEEIAATLQTRIDTLQKHFQTFRSTEYEPSVQKLDPEERAILTEQIRVIEETRNLPALTTHATTVRNDVQQSAQKLVEICNTICLTRNKILEIRQETIAELNGNIESLQLELVRAGDRSLREDYTNTHRDKANLFYSSIDGYAGTELYEKLRTLFTELTAVALDDDRVTIKDPLFDASFVDLLEVVDDDDVQIAMKVGEAGFVPLQNLSAGQRCTAVFPLLLRNNRGPLVIDQPEDNLDNRHIADVVAPELLAKSSTQQFMLTSHNANLVVLTDAGLVIHVDSDGRIGRLEERGFLSCHTSDICESVVDVLDGGRAALEARKQKYGPAFSK